MHEHLLRRIRRKLGLTQTDVAKRLGVSLSTISAYERYERSPYKNVDAILRIAAEADLEVTREDVAELLVSRNGKP